MKQLIAKLKKVDWQLVSVWVLVGLIGCVAAIFWVSVLFLKNTHFLLVAILLTLSFIAFLIPLWRFSSTIRENAMLYDACEKNVESLHNMVNAIDKAKDELLKKIDQSQG